MYVCWHSSVSRGALFTRSPLSGSISISRPYTYSLRVRIWENSEITQIHEMLLLRLSSPSTANQQKNTTFIWKCAMDISIAAKWFRKKFTRTTGVRLKLHHRYALFECSKLNKLLKPYDTSTNFERDTRRETEKVSDTQRANRVSESRVRLCVQCMWMLQMIPE